MHDKKFGPCEIHKTPTFVPSQQLKTACPNYTGKEEVDFDNNALSSAQGCPNKVMFLNEVPIAAGCYYKSDVVKNAVKQVFVAISDLADRKYDMEIKLGLSKLHVKKGSVSMAFAKELKEQHSEPQKYQSLATQSQGGRQLSETWKHTEFSKSMATFLEKPNLAVHEKRIAVANLSVMSKDLTTCK